jgi:hypothetical protein
MVSPSHGIGCGRRALLAEFAFFFTDTGIVHSGGGMPSPIAATFGLTAAPIHRGARIAEEWTCARNLGIRIHKQPNF